MNAYEAKQAARRERLEARADRLRQEGGARVKRGDDALRLIPFGQPILIGHHSEKGDRAYRGRALNNIGKGFAAMAAAEQVAERAASVGTGGVSSDDPDAIAKLQAQLAKAETMQQRMAAANKLVRRFKSDIPRGVAALVETGFAEAVAGELFKPDFAGRLGFPGYALTNNNANIRRIRERIAQLARNAARETKETLHNGGARVVENAEDNRLQLFFPGKPAEAVRTELKRCGFRWSPTFGAWQRQLSSGARYAAECVLKTLQPQA